MSILLYNPLMDVYGPRKSYRFSNNYFRPATDVFESNDSIIVKMDLPGFKQENVLIEATFNELEVKSTFPEESIPVEQIEQIEQKEQNEQIESSEDTQGQQFRRLYQERSTKDFVRKFKFAKPVNPQEAKVSLEDGVLTISLPLRPEAKKINLQIG